MFHTVSSQLLEEQHKGMCCVPKLAMNVMACEVVQLLQLAKTSVVPLSYCVPRKVISPCLDHLFDSGVKTSERCILFSQLSESLQQLWPFKMLIPKYQYSEIQEKLVTQLKRAENICHQEKTSQDDRNDQFRAFYVLSS